MLNNNCQFFLSLSFLSFSLVESVSSTLLETVDEINKTRSVNSLLGQVLTVSQFLRIFTSIKRFLSRDVHLVFCRCLADEE